MAITPKRMGVLYIRPAFFIFPILLMFRLMYFVWLYPLFFCFKKIISLQSSNGFINRLPITSADAILSMYFRYCGLSRSTFHLHNKQTTMYIWASKNISSNKPNLVVIHGFGANSKWQFILQISQLTRDFNVYMPDLIFFGDSYSSISDRSVKFQAECVCDGLKQMGLEKFSVYAISYGGFVGYRMAEVHEDMVEKLVIVSSAIVYTEDRKLEHIKKIGRNVLDLLVPKTPEDFRMLCQLTIQKIDLGKWIPDFFLWGLIAFENCKNEKEELILELLNENPEVVHYPVLTQETLLIWGDKDGVFPIDFGHQLHRHLGGKSKLEIIRNVGHAANFEAPFSLNQLITSFVKASS
ncbi:hypothetical protein L2E82_27745 [Cichorium intybus]|uniref:Uncharacterized protein n=1 Tax=Cichorium intybus TaxID=13427 RepID=A0ACB9CUA3_CICIN|nr:hypothetical protein L2E82_27745 [Cichorium intybus]